MLFRILAAALLATLVAQPASAHIGIGDAHGLLHGFVHPLSGLDHVLAMVAVGIFASQLGGRAALWLVPLTFVAAMVAGGMLGMAGIGIPYVEVGVAVSVLVLGLVVALGGKMPVAIAMALAAVFATFHGHAHGAEMPDGASGLAFGLGFVLATALLHTVGIASGLGIGRLGTARSRPTARIGGGLIAAAGLGLMTGLI